MSGGGCAAVRVLAPSEAAIALDWAAREGWNPGLADAGAFLAQDPGGFLGLFAPDGSLAATISAVRYDGGFAFAGFYICRPDLRGRGHGLALWTEAMARLEGRVIGLDGVVAQQANYARSGFVLAHRNVRHGGMARREGAGPAAATSGDGIRPIGPELRAAVAACDLACFGFARPAFLEAWLGSPAGHALALVADGRVRGYGVVRRCREGAKIGPLFCDDAEGARALAFALARAAGEGPLFLDVPEPNRAGAQIAAALGLAPVFETARMYRGAAPDLPLERIFGITTFELG
ncbi:GNAT family N-acetyltransferase [Xanthobacter pseudotagetidis]|uniref:GNAT family N-acetyltransferase n=1 Tax=Xanthobacter pseudotagetidis TaxID=3119911 RepID=UPI003726C9BC